MEKKNKIFLRELFVVTAAAGAVKTRDDKKGENSNNT